MVCRPRFQPPWDAYSPSGRMHTGGQHLARPLGTWNPSRPSALNLGTRKRHALQCAAPFEGWEGDAVDIDTAIQEEPTRA